MRRTLWKLFPFTAVDSKAAEAWLGELILWGGCLAGDAACWLRPAYL